MTRLPIPPDSAVGVVATGGAAYIRTMLRLLDGGAVAVPLRAAGDRERIAAAAVGRIETPEPGGGWIGDRFVSAPGDDPAMVAFSSGTEGAPKAVLLNRTALHDVVTRLTSAMEIDGAIREYVGVPVHHSFGYGRCRIVLNAGGACYLPPKGFDLTEIRAMLRAGEINAVSAVPSLWRVFLQNRDLFGAELEQVRWVEIGSQFMSAEEKLTLREALPNARIVQHYGLTEASRTTLLCIHAEPAAALASVGRAGGAVGLRIDATGRIEVTGLHLAMGVDDGTAYRPLPPGAWLRTGDLGRIEGGLLHFEGRADDIINCAGIKLSPEAVETHVRETVPGAVGFAVAGRPDSLRGEAVLVALTPEAAPWRDAILQAVRGYAAAQGLDAASAIVAAAVAALPRTDAGKLQRRRLVEGLPAPTAAAQTPAPAAAGSAAGTAAAEIEAILGADALRDDACFHDLGADSLRHMQMTLALERALGAAPRGWEAMPLRALAEAMGTQALLGAPAGARGAPPLPDGSTNANPPGIGFWALVREDFLTNDASLMHQGFLMLFVHRFGNWRMGVRPRLLRAPLTVLYRVLNKLTQLLLGMKLDYTVKVGRRVKLEHFGGMILGAREIGDDVTIRQNTTFGIRSVDDLRAKPTIGANVDIGAGAVIVGDVRIGENSVIGANSVVYMSVPPDSVVIGVPGRIVGRNPRRNPSPLKR